MMEMLDKMGLADLANIHPYQLAPSLMQKVALASCLVNDPQILIIDEPTSQMSCLQSWETMDLIAEFNRQGGTVVMVSHDLELALHFCQRIVVMEAREVRLDISAANCLQHQGELANLGLDISTVLKTWSEGEKHP